VLIEPYSVVDFEVVFGLVAPIGTDLDAVCAELSDQLRIYDYSSDTIRLSQLLDLGEGKDTVESYIERMDAGDAIREQAKSGDAVAALAIAKMLELRGEVRDERKAWILRTLKHDEEIDLLRAIFGARFVLIGVHQAKHSRTQQLRDKLKGGRGGRKSLDSDISALVDRDEMDETSEYGQRVRETYSKSDYFLDLERDISDEAARLLGLMFGQPFLTPTKDEVAMAHAHTASLRSADSGRQVGAAIAASSGEVICVGANEVPKFGGGEYWSGDDPDSRDFAKGVDFNRREMMRGLGELLDVLAEEGHLSTELREQTTDDRLHAVWGGSKRSLRSTRMMSLIEFGRVVHAEMSAITFAARSNVSVLGATLYTTAFPCHMCMRLIISAGIARVVYVDPYPKSMAFEMYPDAITDDPRIEGRVHMDSFNGASWSIYHRVFADHNRKKDDFGKFVLPEKTGSRFLLADDDPLKRASILENQVSSALQKKVKMSAGSDTNDSNIDSNGENDDQQK
jgi:deoxycytidylate deaminase